MELGLGLVSRVQMSELAAVRPIVMDGRYFAICRFSRVLLCLTKFEVVVGALSIFFLHQVACGIVDMLDVVRLAQERIRVPLRSTESACCSLLGAQALS